MIVMLATLITILQTIGVKALTLQPDPPAFPMMGLVYNQTARLSVVTDRAEVPPGPCSQVRLQFVDSDGAVLAQTTQPLTANRAIFLDLNRNAVAAAFPRIEVRGVVRCVGEAVPPPEPDRGVQPLLAGIEVFNSETGKTEGMLPAAQRLLPTAQC